MLRWRMFSDDGWCVLPRHGLPQQRLLWWELLRRRRRMLQRNLFPTRYRLLSKRYMQPAELAVLRSNLLWSDRRVLWEWNLLRSRDDLLRCQLVLYSRRNLLSGLVRPAKRLLRQRHMQPTKLTMLW